jgi:putative transposase
MGVAVTPHTPSRDAVLAALRAVVLREDPYGPFGGLPEQVRIDRGKDFLAKAVTAALGALKASQDDLPAYAPHLKGTVESLNRSVERMHLVALPGYVRAPAPGKRPRRPADHARLMDFATFTADLLGWVEWWNTQHRPAPLGGRTPLEAWQADPTPLDDIPAAELWVLTLEDDGRMRTLTTRGVRWRGRDYVVAWMTGQAGRKVRVRWMPHHGHAIEVYGPATGRHLGSAHLADAATGEQITAVRRARATRARRLKADLEAAEKLRRPRYAAATSPSAPRRLGALTAAEADGELAAGEGADLSALALPDLISPAPSPATWRAPNSSPPRASNRPPGTRPSHQAGRTAGEGTA